MVTPEQISGVDHLGNVLDEMPQNMAVSCKPPLRYQPRDQISAELGQTAEAVWETVTGINLLEQVEHSPDFDFTYFNQTDSEAFKQWFHENHEKNTFKASYMASMSGAYFPEQEGREIPEAFVFGDLATDFVTQVDVTVHELGHALQLSHTADSVMAAHIDESNAISPQVLTELVRRGVLCAVPIEEI